MHLVDIYQFLILSVVLFCTLYQYRKYTTREYLGGECTIYHSSNNFFVLVGVAAITLLMGLRPPDDYWFADSYWYNRNYNIQEGYDFELDLTTLNLLWDNLFNFFAAKQLGISTLFLLSDALYFGCSYLACRKWFPNDTAAAYLVFLGAFSTFSYSYNGIKAGIAASVFILGLAYYEKKLLSIFLILLSWGFHHSMQLPVVALLFVYIIRNVKLYFIFWLLCLLMAALHVNLFQNLFASITDEEGAQYLMNNQSWGGKAGFRLDFIIYSAVPIIIGYYVLIKNKIHCSRMYIVLLELYMLTNSVWMLCMYAKFTNRIAYLSWFLYPFVLIYPLINGKLGKRKYKVFANVMLLHLFFTIFMSLMS